MKHGLITTLIGAAVYLAAATLLPWQRFELAQVEPTTLALGPAAWLVLALVITVAAVALWGLATSRHVVAARALLVQSLLVAAWFVFAQAHRSWDLHLMTHETVFMGLGFALGLIGLLLMFGGSAMAVALAPAWDEATPVVRLRATPGDGVVREVVVYEPRDVALATELGMPALAHLSARLTREAELRLRVPRETRVAVDGRGGYQGRSRDGRLVRLGMGDHALVTHGDVSLDIDYVKQTREVPRRLVLGSEALALALGALLVFLATGVATILGDREDGKRVLPDPERRNATIAALTEEERRADEATLSIDTALLEMPTSAKAAGGVEGRFGDPLAPPERPTKVPPRSGAMLERLPKQIGLLEVVADPRIDRAIAEVLADDGAFKAKLAVATAGHDDGWSLGPGTNGLSLSHDGDGGPGDGMGRVLAQDDIDTVLGPGPTSLPVALGPRERRKVSRVDPPPPDLAGEFCSRSAIESAVRRRAGAIRACYEQRLQVVDDLKGKLGVRWTIGIDGNVTAANATVDTLGDSATTRCVLRTVRNIRFQAPEGGFCVVQYPFIFNPG